jgi:hypothetical protein
MRPGLPHPIHPLSCETADCAAPRLRRAGPSSSVAAAQGREPKDSSAVRVEVRLEPRGVRWPGACARLAWHPAEPPPGERDCADEALALRAQVRGLGAVEREEAPGEVLAGHPGREVGDLHHWHRCLLLPCGIPPFCCLCGQLRQALTECEGLGAGRQHIRVEQTDEKVNEPFFAPVS